MKTCTVINDQQKAHILGYILLSIPIGSDMWHSQKEYCDVSCVVQRSDRTALQLTVYCIRLLGSCISPRSVLAVASLGMHRVDDVSCSNPNRGLSMISQVCKVSQKMQILENKVVK